MNEPKTVEELNQLLKRLCHATFTGRGTGKYYPKDNETSYYKMEYSPGKFILRHKSPSYPLEEVYKAEFREINDPNFKSVEIYLGEFLCKRYSEQKLLELPLEEAMAILTRCVFKDPRLALMSAESVEEMIPAWNDKSIDLKAYSVKIWEDPDPFLGFKVLAEFFVENGVLKVMKLRKFIGGKEITSQNMDITFEYQ